MEKHFIELKRDRDKWLYWTMLCSLRLIKQEEKKQKPHTYIGAHTHKPAHTQTHTHTQIYRILWQNLI